MSAVIRDGQKRLEEVRDCHSQLMQIRSMSELKSESGQSLANIKSHHTARAILLAAKPVSIFVSTNHKPAGSCGWDCSRGALRMRCDSVTETSRRLLAVQKAVESKAAAADEILKDRRRRCIGRQSPCCPDCPAPAQLLPADPRFIQEYHGKSI